MKAWKVIFKNGETAVIRLAGKSLSFRECVEILAYNGYTYNDIHSLDEILEVVF